MILTILIILILFIINYNTKHTMSIVETAYFNYLLFLISKAGIVYMDSNYTYLLQYFTNDKLAIKNHLKLTKKYGKWVKTYILTNTTNYYILDPNLAIKILVMSPNYFSAGLFKLELFKNTMPKNVGVATCNTKQCPWKLYRKYNETIVFTNTIDYSKLNFLVKIIDKKLVTIPKTPNDWHILAFSLTSNILFGSSDGVDTLKLFYDNYKSPNFLYSDKYNKYVNGLKKYIDRGNNYISFMYKNAGLLSYGEFIDQIPHIFAPTIFMIEFLLPQFFSVVLNYVDIRDKILYEINSNSFDIYDTNSFLHLCVIEHIRLFNTININIQRTSNTDINIDGLSLKRGDQVFILFSSILRNSEIFTNPHRFIPTRWLDKKLDRNIVFGVGSQRCISIKYTPIVYKSIIVKLLKNYSGVNLKIDVDSELYFINPFGLKFYTH